MCNKSNVFDFTFWATICVRVQCIVINPLKPSSSSQSQLRQRFAARKTSTIDGESWCPFFADYLKQSAKSINSTSMINTKICGNNRALYKFRISLKTCIVCAPTNIFLFCGTYIRNSQIYVYIIIFLIYVYILYTMIHDRNTESILLILLVWTAITEKYWCWYNWCLMIFWIQANCWNIYDDMNKD